MVGALVYRSSSPGFRPGREHCVQGEVKILLVASCYGNGDKLRPGGPLSSYVDFTTHNIILKRPPRLDLKKS